MKKRVYIILGSNLGDKKSYIETAINEMAMSIGQVRLRSHFYQTSPWGFESEEEFLNRVVLIESELSPDEIMKGLLDIENKLGRSRNSEIKGYESRTIDLDILLIDDMIIDSELLKVPHPRMQDRNFVLVPLAEIAGDFIHPVYNKTIVELISECDDSESVNKVN